jgi:hypothetical protein
MYLEMGVLSPEEVRQSLIDDPESGYGGLDPYEMPEAPEEMAQAEGAPVSGEGQSVGFGQPLADAAFDEAGDGKEWITVNGAHIPLKDGEPSGNVGEKIKAETAKNDSFGKAYPEYSGHPEKAIEKLMNEKAGHVPAAIHKDGIGAIDFVYGEGGKRGYGLAHIADKHGMETVKKVPAIIREGSVDRKHEGFGRIYVSDAKKKAVVRLDWNGQSRKWLATAFDIDE